MYPSDFIYYRSTTDLLTALLYSELGIYSVMHPTAMYHGVILAYPDLKRTLLESEDEFVHSEILKLDVPRKDDLMLFYTVYTNINGLNELMLGDEQITQFGIMPIVAEMVAISPNVAQAVERACISHADAHGDFVRKRMEKTLQYLNITSYIRLNRKVTQWNHNASHT